MKTFLLMAAGLTAFAGMARAAEDPACAFWTQLLGDQAAPFVKFRAGKVDANGIAKGALTPSKAFVCEYQAEDVQAGFTYPRTYSCTATAAGREAVLKQYQETVAGIAACFPDLKLEEQVVTDQGIAKTSSGKRPPFSIQVEAAYDKALATGGRSAGKLTISASWKPPPKTEP